MKVSHKVLKNYCDFLSSPEETAQKLIAHTAEVEDIVSEGQNLESVFIGEVLEVNKHPEADKLNLCQVSIHGETVQIVCGAPNVKAGIKVPVATVGANLKEGFTIEKTKIRWEVSNGMICSEDELGMTDERQEWILILPDDAPLGTCMKEYLGKDDAILEIDNKAINHRPDMFSYIGTIRELHTIYGKDFDFSFANKDFSNLPDIGIKNEIPEVVRRYMGVKVEGVENIPSPKHITDVLSAAEVDSKGLLIDITNYALNFYGQPTHCFDADKLTGNITVRYATSGEKFTALNDKEYELSPADIVIADDAWVIALGWIIGGKDSAVSDATKNIIIESANFDQAVVRKTGKNLGLRTDALNIFEKDLVLSMPHAGASLIVQELESHLSGIKVSGITDIYPDSQADVVVPFDIDFVNNLIGQTYDEAKALQILSHLWIEKKGNDLLIPFWRKDLTTKADIAEEIARIDGYDNIEATIPKVQLWAIVQDDVYTIKKTARNFLIGRWFFDMYNYSFVNEALMNKAWGSTDELVDLRNYLSEELTHMRWDLIPGLLQSIEKNIRDHDHLHLFEIGKTFHKSGSDITENYSIGGVVVWNKELIYYKIQNQISDLLSTLWVDKFSFENPDNSPWYAHGGRTAKIVIRWQEVGHIGEIHPKVAKDFDIKGNVGFFTLNINRFEKSVTSIMQANEISQFQENNFDISFSIDKETPGKNIQIAIEKSDPSLIKSVKLFDIYEDEEKFPGKRSLSFKVFIQSLEWTLDDKVKNQIIQQIVEKVWKKGWELRK